MSIVFISDIHLSSDRPTLTDAFKKFIESQSSNATHIYILGDLFGFITALGLAINANLARYAKNVE